MKRGVYLIEGCGYHKIGMTSNIDERLKTLRYQLPFEIELIAFGRIALQEHLRPFEMKLHSRFSASAVRPRSEWFRLSTVQLEECIDLINNLKPLKVAKKAVPQSVRIEARRQWAIECLERIRANQPIALSIA